MIDNKTLQGFLNMAGNYNLAVDGQFGLQSFNAARDYLADRRYPATWSDDRTMIALQQLFLNTTMNAGLLVDGMAGPKFNAALDVYEGKAVPQPQAHTSPIKPPPVLNKPVRTIWPRQRNVPAFFGENPRTVPTAYVTPAYQMYSDYARRPANRVSRFICHKLVKDPLQRIFAATLEHYGPDRIRKLNLDIFSGCKVVRRITGGSGWSMHSWGIAVDMDAANNEFKDTWASGHMDGPDYEAFVGFWYAEGAINLGRERNYDPMHFQFARL